MCFVRASHLRRSIKHYYRNLGYSVNFPKGGLKVGNAMIDGEAVREGSRVAIELKSDRDDILSGLGQMLQALTRARA